MNNDKVSVIGLAIVSRTIPAPDGGELPRHYLTIENIGFVTVVEFQSRVSVKGTDWERLSKLDLQRTIRRST